MTLRRSPTRRTVLRLSSLTAAGLLAGCISSGNSGSGSGGQPTDDTTTTDEPTPTPTTDEPGLPGDDQDGDGGAGGTRPAGTGGPGFVIASVDDPPEQFPLVPNLEIVESVATEEHPPRLRVTLTNGADGPVRAGEGRAMHFQYVVDDGENPQLVWLPTVTDGSYSAEPGCWRLAEPVMHTEEYRTVVVEAGASVSETVDLYGLPTEEDACLPVGQYRFSTRVCAAIDDEQVPDEGSCVEWGFSILLE